MAFKEVKPFAFIHVPRTAGTTIAKALGIYDKVVNFHGLSLRENIGHHPTAAEVREGLGDSVFALIDKIAFVRNPWDRRVSEFHDRRRYTPARMGPDREYLLMNDFNGWVRYWYCDWNSRCYFEPGLTHYQTTGFPLSAWDFITDEVGNILVDFVGFYEKLHADYVVLARWLGVGYLCLPQDMWYNPSRSRIRVGRLDRQYQEYYDKDTIDMVAEIDQIEIEYFGYDFEGVINENSDSILARTRRQHYAHPSAEIV